MSDFAIFSLKVNFGNSISRAISDDYWNIIDKKAIDAWHDAARLLSKRSFYHDDDTYDIRVDYAPIISYLERHYKVLEELHNRPDFTLDPDPFDRSDIELTFQVRCTAKALTARSLNIAMNFVEYFLFDLFLIMNLASPSSFNLYRARIGELGRGRTISLSSNLFEIAVMNSVGGKLPAIDFLDIKRTFEWYFQIRGEVSLLPQGGVERALFAIFHIVKEDISVNTITWIFYALESLLDTRTGENLRFICSRACILCNLDTNQQTILKKRLRQLYNIRSAFVHGGYQVMHPMQNEVIESELRQVSASLSKPAMMDSKLLSLFCSK